MSSVNKKVIRYTFWSFSIAIMVLIFFFSEQDANASSSISSGFISRVLNLFSKDFVNSSEGEKAIIIDGLQHFVRKSAHFTIYAALGSTLFSAAYTYNIVLIRRFAIALPIALLYAISDEIHQMFIPGRACMIEDVILDFCGSLFGALFILLLISFYNLIKYRRKRMRKKELMRRLSELVMTVENLNLKIKDLTEENIELKKKFEEQSVVSSQQNSEDTKSQSDIHPEEALEIDGFTVKVIEEIDFDNINEFPVTEISSKEEPILNDDVLEYGAEVIGKLTVESAKYCDRITEKGGNNIRELLGLIMGKSEVCKNDILSIAMSDTLPDAKRELIDAQYTEALDYFKSLTEQGL